VNVIISNISLLPNIPTHTILLSSSPQVEPKLLTADATINYSEIQSQVGATQSWNGKLIGSGDMELTEVSDNMLRYDLNFQKPFKSSAKVRYQLSEADGQTTVEWIMDGKLPWFLFFMTKVMKVFIGMDYERGLTMLKEYAETGKVASSLELIGEGELQEMYYMGIEGASSLKEIDEIMQKDFSSFHNSRCGTPRRVATHHKLSTFNKPSTPL